MELRHLRYFIAVAEEQSFRRAAERLHVSPSPLLRQIQDLEMEVGVPLLLRSNSGVVLTNAGHAVLENARAIVEQSQKLFQLARFGEHERAGQIRIAYSVAYIDPVLPKIISVCRERFPQVHIELQQMHSDQMMQDLLERKIDLAFAGIGDSNRTNELMFETSRESPVAVALSRGHRLATAPSISVADLAEESFILLPKKKVSWHNNWILGLCEEAGFTPGIVQEADTTHSMLAMAAAGIGVTLQPLIVSAIPIDICWRTLTPAPKPFEYKIAWNRRDKSVLLREILDLLREVITAENAFSLSDLTSNVEGQNVADKKRKDSLVRPTETGVIKPELSVVGAAALHLRPLRENSGKRLGK
jgi:DNA-binding transcriptional LysR family regulator